MEFDKKKFSEVWEKFSRKDPVQIDSVSYLSLLEVMLREQNPALFDQYNCIKQSMHAIYTNKDLQYLVIDKKDH